MEVVAIVTLLLQEDLGRYLKFHQEYKQSYLPIDLIVEVN